MSEAAAVLEEPRELPEGAACAVHPESAALFVCTRCGTFGCDACVFSRVEKREVCKTCASKGLGEPIPWERRSEIGWWRSFWKTVRLASRSPSAFFRTPTTERSAFGAVAHGTLTVLLGLLLTYCVLGLMMMLGAGAASAFMEDREAADMFGALLGTYGCTLFGMGPIGVLMSIPSAIFAIVISAALSHGFLAIFDKTKGSFEDTLRAVSYANAPRVWAWIPVFGGIITMIWTVWIEVIALRETHRCGTDWAIAAAVGYRIVLFVAIVVIYGVLIAAGVLMGSAAGG